MGTVGKIAIGAAVVIGGIVVYKLVAAPTPAQTAARASATPAAGAVNGFVNLATSVFGYFSKNQPAAQVVPGSRNNSWDSSSDLLLPLGAGETAYRDSTANDSLLS